ncbi:hypothetical protein [Corallococcus exercitus]|uniref:hypothetical protein n=1 Tax=Corallococcus exercitus TaxID=2316736 RepID=UPI0035D4B178
MGRGIWVWCWALVALLGLTACDPGTELTPCAADCEGAACAACVTSLPEERPQPALACDQLPAPSRCLGPRVLERCEGGAVHREDCAEDTTCVESPEVACVAGSACVDGVSRCTESRTLQVCTNGRWVTRACDVACNAAPGRGFCGAPGPTLSGTVRYARRFPDAEFRAWALEWDPVPARGFLIVSFQGTKVLDSQVTDDAGRFTLKVSPASGEEDRIVVYAAGRGRDGAVAYAVADPGLPGEQVMTTVPGEAARIWSWSRTTRELSGQPIFTLTEAEGSGAAAVFDVLGTAWRRMRERYGGRDGLPVVAWLGFGTTWSCGACFAPWPVTAVGRNWESQVWLPGDSDAAWWSDAMVMHELGHWVMASRGTSPEEGGPHFVGVPTFPGQAWSEGWATWFSSDARRSPRYFDRQAGTMFWVDLSARASSVSPWMRPRAEAGLLQPVDENEVAAILYRTATGTSSSQPLYDALAAPAMNRSPWARGYTRHTWKRDEKGALMDVVDTGRPSPSLADFLDALMCQGFPSTLVDAATEPATAFPYPSHEPLCP